MCWQQSTGCGPRNLGVSPGVSAMVLRRSKPDPSSLALRFNAATSKFQPLTPRMYASCKPSPYKFTPRYRCSSCFCTRVSTCHADVAPSPTASGMPFCQTCPVAGQCRQSMQATHVVLQSHAGGSSFQELTAQAQTDVSNGASAVASDAADGSTIVSTHSLTSLLPDLRLSHFDHVLL